VEVETDEGPPRDVASDAPPKKKKSKKVKDPKHKPELGHLQRFFLNWRKKIGDPNKALAKKGDHPSPPPPPAVVIPDWDSDPFPVSPPHLSHLPKIPEEGGDEEDETQTQPGHQSPVVQSPTRSLKSPHGRGGGEKKTRWDEEDPRRQTPPVVVQSPARPPPKSPRVPPPHSPSPDHVHASQPKTAGQEKMSPSAAADNQQYPAHHGPQQLSAAAAARDRERDKALVEVNL
jgi:hypothetical protein